MNCIRSRLITKFINWYLRRHAIIPIGGDNNKQPIHKKSASIQFVGTKYISFD